MNHKFLYTILFTVSFLSSNAQNILTIDNAVSIALDKNFGIKIAENNTKIAENNASVFNSDYLPSITGNAGATYDNNNTIVRLADDSRFENKGAETVRYNTSVGLNYTIFDGLGRSYNYKRLKELYNLSELEAENVIENTLILVINKYYEIARLTENRQILSESLDVSKQRLTRMKFGFEFGQNTKLDILNAEVDVNTDSIRYINENRFLANAKRDLNLYLGRTITEDFLVDTKVSFNLFFEYESLIEKAKEYNIQMQKIEKNIELGNYDIKINKSNLYPTLNLNSSYGLNYLDNGVVINFKSQESYGFNAGVSLNWNIFDGGTTKTRIQNSKIIADNLIIEKEQVTNELERNVANALEVYNNAIIILNTEEKNVETNMRNFERSVEQFKLGQITSIEFRQAQINLLNAKSNLNEARYQAKNAELFLLQLSGQLLDVEF
jgi:outer membrane protein TolC